jgi:hypothetical protein
MVMLFFDSPLVPDRICELVTKEIPCCISVLITPPLNDGFDDTFFAAPANEKQRKGERKNRKLGTCFYQHD